MWNVGGEGIINVGVKRAQLQDLRKEFEILSKKMGGYVDEYFALMLEIANKMNVHGEKLTLVTCWKYSKTFNIKIWLC